jgi:hypothetical protein
MDTGVVIAGCALVMRHASLQGNCTKATPSGLLLEGHTPPQCVLKVTDNFLLFLLDNMTVFVGSLHLYAARKGIPNRPVYELLHFQSKGGQAWVSNVTLQGTGELVRGIATSDNRLYVEGVMSPSFSQWLLCHADIMVKCTNEADNYSCRLASLT